MICLGLSLAYAQSKPEEKVHILEEVIIPSNRLKNFATGSKIEEIDSTIIVQNSNNSLADLLSTQTQVFVKSYSIAGLSTPSFRGTNASQTAILWNGFNLGSPMNGGQDLALLPVNFVNNVKLQFGGAGALWGSGAIGGTIHLNNTPQFNKGLSLYSSSSIGSFEDRQQNFEVSISKNRFISTTKFFYHEAKNDFPFINTSEKGKPEQRLSNAEFYQKGILQENYFKINNSQNLSFRLWLQKNDRNIPASMSSGVSTANQKDDATRSTLEWQRIKTKVSYFVRSAYFDETLKYTNPQISLISKSQTKAFINEAESRINLTSQQSINLGINNTYNIAFTKDYATAPTQNRIAFFGSYSIRNQKSTLKASLSTRKEFISNNENPFTASIGLEGIIIKHFKLRATASKNYRLPTFNDLYWAQGGNPNLLPEEGYNEELGLTYFHCKGNLGFELGATVFNSNINNWIMWRPDSKGIWSPENVLKVWSRGFENDLKVYYTLYKLKLDMSAHYQSIQTTNEATTTKETDILGKQLIYTPQQKAIANIGIEFMRFRLSGSYNYVGKRFTTSDNSEFLLPYSTFNLDLSKTFTMPSFMLKAYIQVYNINNESYQIIKYYPVAGRSFQIGITINFNKPNK